MSPSGKLEGADARFPFHALIPVLGLDPRDVAGIQCARVLGRGRLPFDQVIHGADAPWLDSCDIPRAKP
ncbi:hypothetical protein B5K08_01315 [Rhizobium leguminosarum bv. trifolii]|uniref:Uncharacterized protein n=1 Tax=Rhizobium leguminosarum bv. trifolii TaxID=386 RepID=A0A3E1BZZ6_RHILT|nr:hypothetical protein B5K08_01315 [Rhizobium leguminosarum bv. trifolii]RFC01195.1 hypothetical protein B5K10_01315 [Rhizobium leguminosarum bv. trifolii]